SIPSGNLLFTPARNLQNATVHRQRQVQCGCRRIFDTPARLGKSNANAANRLAEDLAHVGQKSVQVASATNDLQEARKTFILRRPASIHVFSYITYRACPRPSFAARLCIRSKNGATPSGHLSATTWKPAQRQTAS